jgi:ligand-binding SRPBCC domain-containing protein
VSDAFEFFADVHNLNRLTPSWFDLRILSPQPIRPGVGTRIDYRLRWRGVPMRWQSVITEWRVPQMIAYEQGDGPYRFFRHEHHFVPEAEGTRVIDRVTFAAPGGRLIHDLIVEPDLHRIFRHRHLVVNRLERPAIL